LLISNFAFNPLIYSAEFAALRGIHPATITARRGRERRDITATAKPTQ
jgi:hypothetical protein